MILKLEIKKFPNAFQNELQIPQSKFSVSPFKTKLKCPQLA